jgi:hypothetical protein
MSSIWTRPAVFVASAALISMAFVPALAQPEETSPPPAEVQAPQAEPGYQRQSRPRQTEETPEALKLRAQAAAGKCRSGADTEAEAVEDCKSQLNCPAGTTVKCQYRQNHRDWICSCK